MADAELVETGMAGSTVTDLAAEESAATDPPGPVFQGLLSAESEALGAEAGVLAIEAEAEEPVVHLQGKPAWSFSLVQQSVAVPSLGPSGRRRHPLTVLLASALTLGVYSIVWHARINREISEFDARLEVAPRRSALAVSLAWLAGFACSLAGAALMVGHQVHIGPSLILATTGFSVAGHTVLWDWLMLGGIVAIPYLALALPFSVVAVVMTLERLRVAEERAGLAANLRVRPVRHACLLSLPVIGGLLHVAVLQSRLNQVWQRAYPAGAPGRS